jgi:hypothetical protein
MNRRPLPFARKYRQYRYLAKRLQRWLDAGAFTQLSAEKRQSIQQRLQRLYDELKGRYATGHLRNLLASGVFLLGMHSHSQGQIAFDVPVVNPFGLTTTGDNLVPTFVDIDGDGDLDLFTGQYFSGSDITYYENIGTAAAPAFGPPQVNPFGLTSNSYYATLLDFADLDGDGDQDAISGDYYGGFSYLENTGTLTAPAFAAPQPNPFGLTSLAYVAEPNLVDLDNDGDLDLLAGDLYGDFTYFENTGTPTAPAFAAAQANPFGLANFGGGYLTFDLVDVDQDGDLDIFAGGYAVYGDILFFENTGTSVAPAFAAAQVTPFGLTPTTYYSLVGAADLDDDGDPDLLVGSYNGELTYFENITNLPPVLTLAGDTVICGGDTLSYAFMATDSDSLSFVASSSDQAVLPNANLTITGTAPNYLLQAIPAPGQFGSVMVLIEAFDGTLVSQDSFMLLVEDCNTAPIFAATPDSQTVCLGDSIGPLSFGVSDAEGDSLTFSFLSTNPAVLDPASLSVSGTGPYALNGTALTGDPGAVTLTLIASDGALSDSVNFVVVVEDCNTAPTFAAAPSPQVGCLGDPIEPLSFGVNDAEGDSLTFSFLSSDPSVLDPTTLSVSGTGPYTLSSTALAGGTGPVSVTLIASDGALSDSVSFDLTVNLCTSISQALSNGWSLAPNPTHEVVQIRLAQATDVAGWRLLDLQGRAVRAWEGTGVVTEHRLSLRGIPAGTYLLAADTPQGLAWLKVVKQ